MVDIEKHKNVEQVIRWYLSFLPPRHCKSILDIGAGTYAPYRGIMKNRCDRYAAMDIRPGKFVDYVCSVTEMPFKDNEWEWGWCVEVMEHLPSEIQEQAVMEILRVCQNAVFCYPIPIHPSFSADPGHVKVIFDFNSLNKERFHLKDKSSKTGRNVYIITEKGYRYPKDNIKPTSLVADWL